MSLLSNVQLGSRCDSEGRHGSGEHPAPLAPVAGWKIAHFSPNGQEKVPRGCSAAESALLEIYWRRKRDSLVRNYLITHKLLIFQLARLAQFASKRHFW